MDKIVGQYLGRGTEPLRLVGEKLEKALAVFVENTAVVGLQSLAHVHQLVVIPLHLGHAAAQTKYPFVQLLGQLALGELILHIGYLLLGVVQYILSALQKLGEKVVHHSAVLRVVLPGLHHLQKAGADAVVLIPYLDEHQLVLPQKKGHPVPLVHIIPVYDVDKYKAAVVPAVNAGVEMAAELAAGVQLVIVQPQFILVLFRLVQDHQPHAGLRRGKRAHIRECKLPVFNTVIHQRPPFRVQCSGAQPGRGRRCMAPNILLFMSG